MNIFHLDKSPMLAAQFLCDKHVPKMIVETGQMLSAAHHYHESEVVDRVYKLAYPHHPMTQWVWKTGNNYQWAYSLLCHLIDEFYHRGFKNGEAPATQRIMGALEILPAGLKNTLDQLDWMNHITAPPLCMPKEYHGPCHIEAYRNYYIHEKHTFKDGSKAVWERGRDAPYWWRDVCQEAA